MCACVQDLEKNFGLFGIHDEGDNFGAESLEFDGDEEDDEDEEDDDDDLLLRLCKLDLSEERRLDEPRGGRPASPAATRALISGGS